MRSSGLAEDWARAIRASPRSVDPAGHLKADAYRRANRYGCTSGPLRCGESLILASPSLAALDPRNASKPPLV